MKIFMFIFLSISLFATDLIEVCINRALNKPTNYTATNADLQTITEFTCNYMGDINFTKVGLMTNLKMLEMRGNILNKYNLDVIKNLTKIEYIKLNGNSFNCLLPNFTSTNLKHIDLATNNLYGNIPKNIGNLVNLEILDLSNNNLGGSIPNEITNLTKLKRLYLQFNQLVNNIPPNIGNLKALDRLKLNHNHLMGVIPKSIIDLNLSSPAGLNLRDNCNLRTDDNNITNYIEQKSSFYRGFSGVKSSGGRCINMSPIFYLLL